ncbi:MAG: undecaprenyl-phosphate glucose phosphotransferase [Clostridia bacterium]|nr:undecaprenyl-phosphate glucose phosphotransferase [Clostridia bacterium]
MKSTQDNHQMLKNLDMLLDFILNLLFGWISYLVARFMFVLGSPIDTIQMLTIVVIFSVITTMLYNYHNVYLPMRVQSPLFFVSHIFLVNIESIVVGVILILLFVSRSPYTSFYLSWLIAANAISFTLIASKKITMLSILHSMRIRQHNLKRILLVTDSQEMADEYVEEIFDNPQFGYSVIGYVGNLNVVGLEHLGNTGDLDRVIKEEKPDEVIIALDTVRKKLITRYIGVCNNNCVKVMVVPAIVGYFKSPRQISMMGNLPLLDIRSTPLDNPFNRFLKRTLDIIGSLMMIAVTSPLMLFTAIGVKLSSPGPILFRQIRVGRNNEEFTMYKFRSMRVNDAQQTGWSTENDPRKTRFGAFIRKFALDELPQFFNVLKGDMSLVGPRPEVPFYVEQFKKQIPLYMLKHSLRPGITGQAQIKGLRGDTSIQARIEEDINYIENWTFWSDIRILLLTPFHAVNRQEKYAERDKREEEKRNRGIGGALDRGDEDYEDEI